MIGAHVVVTFGDAQWTGTIAQEDDLGVTIEHDDGRGRTFLAWTALGGQPVHGDRAIRDWLAAWDQVEGGS